MRLFSFLVWLYCIGFSTPLAAGVRIPDGISLLEDIAYAPAPLQKIDVYRPHQASAAPVIVMVHGGAWRIGDKSNRGVVEGKLSHWGAKGFVFVSVNYRMLPDADPLTQAEDVARALAYIQKHASDWGGNGEKVILMGHSAGAHLVSLLAVRPEQVYEKGGKKWLGTLSLDTAAFDMVKVMENPHPRFYDRAFGKAPDYWRRASPYHQINKALDPFLAVCSSKRKDKPCAGAQHFADKAKALGGHLDVVPVAMSHREINADLGIDRRYTAVVDLFLRGLDPEVAAFLDKPINK